MIRRLRKTHLWFWLALAVALPLIVAASVVFRHAATSNDAIPSRLEKR